MRLRLLHLLRAAIPLERTRPSWADLPEVGIMAIAFMSYFIVRGGVIDRTGEALRNARGIIDFQRSLGLFVEPAVNAWTLGAAWRVHFFDFVYFWLDFPLIIVVAVVLFWRNRRSYTLLRDALLISGGFALIFYWAFPVAPPRLLPEWGFVDTLQHFAHLSYQAQSLSAFVNPFAAVPSLHVGWSLLLAIVLFKATGNGWIRGAGMVVLILQSIAVIATANHYLFDAMIGVLVSLCALVVAVWLQREGYPRVLAWIRRQVRGADRRSARARALEGVDGV